MNTIDVAAYVKLENRVKELEATVNKIKGNLTVSAPLIVEELIETVTLSVAGPIRLPSVGNFPTQYKDILIRGKLRSNKAAVTNDPCIFTINAVASNYYTELIYNNAATTVAAIEGRAAANLQFSVVAATAPTGVFTHFELSITDYNAVLPTLMSWRYGNMFGTGAGGLQVVELRSWVNSNQAVNYLTFNVAAANNLLAGSYLSAYGIRG